MSFTKPVCLGVNTIEAQYGELTPFAAMREIPDNALGVSDTLGSVPGKKVGVTMYVKDAIIRKGSDAPYPGRMTVMATQTKYEKERFDNGLRVVQPKKGDQKSHSMQHHGSGTSNCTAALGPGDLSGQCLVLRCAAREGPPRSDVLPTKISAVRFGEYANEVYSLENPDEEKCRGVMQGELFVFKDLNQTRKHPYACAFAAHGAQEPTDARAFKAKIFDYTKGTSHFLDYTPFAHDIDANLNVNDLGNSLLEHMNEAWEKLAKDTKQSLEEVMNHDTVLYFFWSLRDEIQVAADGAILVESRPLHELLQDSYLPCQSPTRTQMMSSAPMPNPLNLCMTIGSQPVRPNQNWVLKQIAEARILPVSYKHGHGTKKQVIIGNGYMIESYQYTPLLMMEPGFKQDPIVQFYTAGGLAIGKSSDFFLGHAFCNAPVAENLLLAQQKLRNHLDKNSLHNLNGGKSHYLHKAQVPDSDPFSVAQVTGFRTNMQALDTMHKEVVNKDKKGRDAAAGTQVETWNSANPHASRQNKCAKTYEIHCRAGGSKMDRMLSQIAYMSAGANILHLVTITDKDMALSKAKSSILGDSVATKGACTILPQLNLEIMTSEVNELTGWREEDIKRAEEEKVAAEKVAAEKAAEKKANEEAGKKAKQLAKEKEQLKVMQANLMKLGCYPILLKDSQVKIVSCAKGADPPVNLAACEEVGIWSREHLETQLRTGNLSLPSGRAKGKLLTFKGNASKGQLFGGKSTKSLHTEIVLNPAQAPPPTARAPQPAARPQQPAARPPQPAARPQQKAPPPPKESPGVPELVQFEKTFTLDNGHAVPFEFSALVTDAVLAQSLMDGGEDAQLQAFVAAALASDRLWGCFNASGMKMPNEAFGEYRLRIVPVLVDQSPVKALAYPSETVSGPGYKEVVVYLSVAGMLAGRPNNGMSEELRITWLTMKIAEAVAKGYADKIDSSAGPKLKQALLGMMLATSYDAVVTAKTLKRKAPADAGAPPAKKSTSSGGASSSADNGALCEL